MFVQVRLLKGFSKQLLYKIPNDWNDFNLFGKIIKVPIQNRISFAIVENIIDNLPEQKFEIKNAISIENFPNDFSYQSFIAQLSNYYQIDSINLINRIHKFIKEKKLKKLSEHKRIVTKEDINLTKEQSEIYEFLKTKINTKEFSSTLLHGVTGSGKTEVYKKLIQYNFEQNKSSIILLPEVTLSLKFEKIFQESLPGEIEIYSFHSSTPSSEKKQLWQKLIENKPIVIIGVHLPILLPISNLGLIIIDEEHDISYQEKKHPKINSKDAAILKAKLNNIPVLLGSATPSISTLFNVKYNKWNFFQLKKRYSGNFPDIEIVKLNDKKQRKNFWISTKLENEIKDRLEKKEQTIIFINRRGYCFFVQCKNCNFIFKCSNCSVSLTLHKNNWLYCHYCNLSIQFPTECKECKSNEFLKKGIGTEQIVSILENIFPYAKIARADLDVSSRKKIWEKTLTDFLDLKIDILVGTQTITKGYHFPKVTLVGILWADLNLNFPIYNSSEQTLQQLIQVAGRAGRQSDKSKVIIQTMQEHKIFDFVNEINYLQFYKQEFLSRKNSLYPPAFKLVEIELKTKKENILEVEAIKFAQELRKNNLNHQILILGPAKPSVEKIKNQFMRKIFIKAKNIKDVIELYEKIDKTNYKSKIFFTPNPLN